MKPLSEQELKDRIKYRVEQEFEKYYNDMTSLERNKLNSIKRELERQKMLLELAKLRLEMQRILNATKDAASIILDRRTL